MGTKMRKRALTLFCRIWLVTLLLENLKCGCSFSLPNGSVEVKNKSKIENDELKGADGKNGPKVMHGLKDDILNKYTLGGAMGLSLSRPVRIVAKWVTELDELEAEQRHQGVNKKLIHFQRHGQGYHNLLGEMFKQFREIEIDSNDPKRNPFVMDETLDAPLTELGREQCRIAAMDSRKYKPQAVVTSSMQRAVQTAMLTLPDLLPQRNNGDLNVPWIVHEGCREHLGFLKCNQRRALSEIKLDFPTLDYSEMADVTEEDTSFNPNGWESPLEMSNRAYDFLVNFIRPLSQSEIFVVTHSAFLYNMCNTVLQFEPTSNSNDQDEASLYSNLHPWFKTAEIRTFSLTFYDNDN